MLLEQRMILINDNPYDPYVSTRFFEPQKFFSLGQKPVVKMLIHLHQMNYMYCHLMSQVFLSTLIWYKNLVPRNHWDLWKNLSTLFHNAFVLQGNYWQKNYWKNVYYSSGISHNGATTVHIHTSSLQLGFTIFRSHSN